MSYSGYRSTSLFVDEAAGLPTRSYGDIKDDLQRAENHHAADALAYMATAVRPTVKPIDVPCRYCDAEPGHPCMKWRRGRRGKVLRNRGPHPDRKYDARVATEAVRALNSR